MKKNVHKGSVLELKKLFLIMRLIIIFLITSFVSVGANSYSQTARLSVNLESATIEEIFEAIEKQSEYIFFYQDQNIDLNRVVSIEVEHKTINEVLDELFKDTGNTYQIKDRQVLIGFDKSKVVKEEEQLQDVGADVDQPQKRTITGKVSDENGESLLGASVVVKGTTVGVTTDMDGNYNLEIPDNAEILVFSFVGMKSQEVVIGTQTQINAIMEANMVGLEEVVAVGYGTMKKMDITGSSVSADIDAFREAPNVSILQSLQGSVPGVTIGQVNQAGEEASINIRGTSTLNGNKNPLIVVDNIIFSGRFSDINPADVESVEILKDASSKAIYGAQAANGVILVTTKTGKNNKASIFSYSGSVSTSSPTIDARLLNKEEYLKKVRDIEWRNAYTEASAYTEINPDWDYYNSDMGPVILDGIDAGIDYDWWDAVTQPAYLNNHTFSVTGGTDKTSYYLSAGYSGQSGFIKNDDYSRLSLRLNFDTEVTSWLTVGANISGSFLDFSGEYPTMNSIVSTAPTVSPWDENGDFIINPVGNLALNLLLASSSDDYNKQNRFVGNFYGIIDIPWVKGLTYRINQGNNMKFFKDFNSTIYGAGLTGSSHKINAYQYETTLDNILNYTKRFGDHDLNATFVYGYNKLNYERTAANGEGYSDLDLSYNNIELAEIHKIESSAWDEASLYQMLRVGYNYQQKYLLTATVRRDGFSGFAENHKSAIFPSVGLGWVITSEDFMNVPGIDYLKLRCSYGENGNKVERYQSLAVVETGEDSKYVFGDGASTSIGRSVASLSNSDLKWEKTLGVNLGLDYAILDSRIKGNIEYYNSNTNDLLWTMVLPKISGFENVLTNIGEINNTGIELYIEGSPVKTSDFNWNVGLSLSHNKNTIKSLLGEDNDGDGVEDDLISSGLFIGESIGAIYGYEIDGVWQIGDDMPVGFEPGSYKVIDQDGDGSITEENDRILIGHEEPAYQFGIQNTLKYKNFTLRFFINSIQGGKNGYMGVNHPEGSYETKGNATNTNWFNFYDYWAPTRPDAKYSNPWVGSPVNSSAKRYFQRNFVRLQDISLSYTLPQFTINKLSLKGAKIYVSGKNLLTLTKWDGWDPETGQGIATTGAFPLMKSYTIGIDLTF